MTSIGWIAATVAAGFVAAGAAPQTSTSGAPAGKDTAKAITVTGCVEPNTQPVVNTPVGPGYRLTHVTVKDERATGTSGTAAASSKAGAARSYILDGPDADLKTHVGHTVAVMGVPLVGENAVVPPALHDAAPTVVSGGTKTVDNGAPRLEVRTITMIASDCKP
jgi:hypothetical protein